MAVITISRQYGAEGGLIARLVAEKLGYELVDRDRMVATAQQQGIAINQALVPEIDEKKPSFWERLDEERRRYNLLLRHLIFDYAEQDRCVIVGHGAETYLAGLNQVLKIKVIAPIETRAKRVMVRDRLNRDAALSRVRQIDRERAGYLKYLCQEDWLNSELYDIVFNTDKFKPEFAVGLIAQAVEDPALISSMVSRQVLSDRALSCRVDMRLLIDPRIGSTSLRVTANRGEVTIDGTLATDEEKEAAEEIASTTPGVNRLVSELVVVPITSSIYP